MNKGTVLQLNNTDGTPGWMLLSNAATHSPLMFMAYPMNIGLNSTRQRTTSQWDTDGLLEGPAPQYGSYQSAEPTFESFGFLHPHNPLEHSGNSGCHNSIGCQSAFHTLGEDLPSSAGDLLAHQCTYSSDCYDSGNCLWPGLQTDGLYINGYTENGLEELYLGPVLDAEGILSEEVECSEPDMITVGPCGGLCYNECLSELQTSNRSSSISVCSASKTICSPDSIHIHPQRTEHGNNIETLLMRNIKYTPQIVLFKESIPEETTQPIVLQETMYQGTQKLEGFTGQLYTAGVGSKKSITIKRCSIPLVRLKLGKSVLQKSYNQCQSRTQTEIDRRAQSIQCSSLQKTQPHEELHTKSEEGCTKEHHNSTLKSFSGRSNLITPNESHGKMSVLVKSCSIPLFRVKFPREGVK